MSASELINVLFKLVDLLNFEWNVHFVFVVAFFGWLLSMKRNPTIAVKILVSVGVVLFAAFSVATLMDYYRILQLAVEELQAATTQSTFQSKDTYAYIQNLSSRHFQLGIWLVQLPIDVLLLIGLWFDNLWKREP
jgi:hypothetical protein